MAKNSFSKIYKTRHHNSSYLCLLGEKITNLGGLEISQEYFVLLWNKLIRGNAVYTSKIIRRYVICVTSLNL